MPGAVGVALILAAGALLAAAYGERPVAGLPSETLAWLLSLAALALVVAGGIVAAFRERASDGLRVLTLWGVLAGGLVALHTHREAAQDLGYRFLAELAPGRAVVGAGGEVTVARRADGAFTVRAEINGHPLAMAFDTGASTVVLSAESAAALGLAPAASAFTVTVHTANGRGTAAPVVLDAVAVGPIVARAVPALVVRPGMLGTDLLGLSFLERLASYEVQGGRLILRGAGRPT